MTCRIYILGIFLLAAPHAHAQEYSISRKASLAHLGGVHIAVSDVPDELQKRGLRSSRIEDFIASKLRRVGIKVNTTDPRENSILKFPFLYLGIEASQSEDGKTFAVSFSLECRQMVELTNGKRVYGATYSAGMHTGIYTAGEMAQTKEAISGLTQTFIRNWVSAHTPD